MVGIMIFIGYLLIGSMLGWKNHKMFEEVVLELMDGLKPPPNVRRVLIALCVITFIALAPIVGLIDLIKKLKLKNKSSKSGE